MGPSHRLVNEASDLNRQVPSQRQWNSATQTEGELTTVADRPRTAIESKVQVWYILAFNPAHRSVG